MAERKNISIRNEDVEAINQIHEVLGNQGFSSFMVESTKEAYASLKAAQVLKEWFPESLEQLEQREYLKKKRLQNLTVSKSVEQEESPERDDIPELGDTPKNPTKFKDAMTILTHISKKKDSLRGSQAEAWMLKLGMSEVSEEDPELWAFIRKGDVETQ
jgi:hypothetical protein